MPSAIGRMCITAAMAATLCTGMSARQDPLADLLAKAAEAVARLESTCATVTFEETLEQKGETVNMLGGSSLGVGGGANSAMIEGNTKKYRQVAASELLLTRATSAALVWTPIRNVRTLDGKPSGQPAARLATLAADTKALQAQLSSLVTESAATIVGPPGRPIHAPWLPLALLRADQQGRSVFKKEGEEAVGSVKAWKVSWLEQKSPALLRTTGNVQVPSRGTFWIDPASGNVLRAKLEIGTGLSMEQYKLEVEFVVEAALGVSVPTTMKDRFENTKGKFEAKATYSALRRIEPARP